MVDKTFLFVTREYWPGVVNCLGNMRAIIEKLNPNSRIDTILIGQHNVGFDIIKRLKQNPPNYLILGGWDEAMKMIVHNSHRKTKVILKWCSPITQIELGGEMPQFAEIWHLSKTDKIDSIGFGLESDVETLKKSNSKVVHLPIYLDTRELDKIETDSSLLREGLNCDIFCAANPRKNILAQIFALSNFRDKITAHVNFGHNVPNVYPIIASYILPENLVNHGWVGDRKKYLSIIKSMDFSMASTLSESFNYTAGEHMYYGIPVVCSEVAPFVRGADAIKDIVIRRPEDLSEIERAIRLLVEDEDARKEMGKASKEIFIKYNDNSKEILEENLGDITQ